MSQRSQTGSKVIFKKKGTKVKLNLKSKSPNSQGAKPTTQTRKSKYQSQLLEHQRNVVKFMLSHRGALVYHGMGSGKTRIAVILVALLKRPAVVVLPASLKENFYKEIHATKVSESLFEVYSMKSFLDHTPDCKDKILIVDEAHMLRNPEGKVSKKVLECAESALKVLLLTGTPLVNRPGDIAPLLNMIVKDKINITVGSSFLSRKTFRSIPTGEAFVRAFGPDGLNDTGRKLWAELFPCVFSYYLPPKSPDFPSMQVIDVKVPMSADQATVYKAWETKSLTPAMVRMLMNPDTEVDVTKMPQFRAYLDGGRRICNAVSEGDVLSAPKFYKMISNLQQTPGKAIVFSHYLAKGIDVAANVLDGNDITYKVFTGNETPTQKKDAVDAYNKDKVRCFLFSSAGGVGLDLKETMSVHVMDPAWNESDIFQAIYRAVRYKSHKDPNTIVKVFRYYCYKPYESKTLSADMYLYQVSQKKNKINQEFLTYAIDHAMESQGVGSCTIETL
jgi:SNF2 family DNA or RNA helicase